MPVAATRIAQDSSRLSAMQTVQITLSDAEAMSLKRRTGKRTLVAAVKALVAVPEPEPVTRAQARASLKKAKADGVRWKITAAMRDAGFDEKFLS